MQIISVINYKGGVGKTTVTANLGAGLAKRGKKVLLLDFDPQASLTFSLMRVESWNKKFAADKTIKKWFESFIARESSNLGDLRFRPTVVNDNLAAGSVHMIPSHLGLINIDLELATMLGGAGRVQQRNNFLQVHSRLKAGLAELPQDSYDYVLIDCPPNFNIVTKTAIVASDWLLIPARPDYLSTMGIDYLKRNLDDLVNEFNHYAAEGEVAPIIPQILGVVFTMIQYQNEVPISAQRPWIAQVRELGLPVFDNGIRGNNTVFAGAPETRLPVILSDQVTHVGRVIVDELKQLVLEFSNRLEKGGVQ